MIKEKQYKNYINEMINYNEAEMLMKKGLFCSRKEWSGFHFIRNGKYYIMLKTGEILINPKEVYCTDKNDWMIAFPTDEALLKINDEILRG